jgi:predicted transcriptional regulator of viral defense system
LSTDVAELAHGGAAGSSLPHMAILDPRAGLLRRADAVADGFSDVELARLVRRGELARLQRGTYLTDPTAAPAELAARHALRVAATISDLRVPAVVSHLSAAALHGLPLWGVRLSRVHVLRRPPASGASNVRLHLHVARYADEDIAVVEGLALTDVTRTVVDVARTASFEAAVVVADAALYRRLTSQIRLRECLARMGPVPGVRAAARALAFADGLSESVGESRSRVAMHRLRLPSPDLQVRVLRGDRSEIGRCDFGWEQFRTVGEFDGRIKYGRLLRPGEDPGDAVFAEKRREDELRDHRWEVARWVWADLDRPAVMGARIRRAFARGRR